MEEDLFVRLGQPEYQEYMDYPGFTENSHYDPLDDFYFINKEWYDSRRDY